MLTRDEVSKMAGPTEAQIQAAEQLIDDALVRARRSGLAAAWVQVKNLGGPHVVAVIQHRYERAGWKVRIHSDQREGTALVIE